MASSTTLALTLPRPDDWHLHLRDGASLTAVLSHMPRTMARAIIMPNLRPPVRSTDDALAYRARILAALPAGSDFEPLMTLYLTDSTQPDEIDRALATGGKVVACKLYPAGATTNSDAGVTAIEKVFPVLARMEKLGFPLLVHGEVTRGAVDVFEREPVFIAEVARPVIERFPALKVVLEHITTREAAAFVEEAAAAGKPVAATITAHHLMYNRNALFEGGLRPHRYCLPVLKHELDRQALLDVAVRRGGRAFFLGTDSAPHAKSSKECGCGAAGCFTAHAAIELYHRVFEAEGALQHLRAFACENGPRFYGLPLNADRLPTSAVELRAESWLVPETFDFGGDAVVVPVLAGESLAVRAHVVDAKP
jgi:dihydroorotase